MSFCVHLAILSMRPPPQSFSVRQGKENKFSLKGSVPTTMIATVELMAINKKKGIFGFKGELPLLLACLTFLCSPLPLLCAVDVPTRTYIFAPQPEKLQLSEKEAQGWVRSSFST
jgi:hypothetical protein